MNEDQNMFAEMLGIRRQKSETVTHVARSVDRQAVEAEDFVDELDVQKEVVEEMAREKAEIEERCNLLEAEKQALEAEKQSLAAQKLELESAKGTLEAKLASSEAEVSRLQADLARMQAEHDASPAENPELAALRAENVLLETKLARMGRSLMAARRAAAEASKVEIGGRRW